MHVQDAAIEELTRAIVDYAVERVRMDVPPLDGPRPPAELRAAAGPTITPSGIGGQEALRVFAEVLAPACISVDHPRFLSFVPAAPTEASILFDLVVGASSIYAGSWLEGGGAVFAENEALRWIADLAGLPSEAGGVFVSGGTAGNLSALIAARYRWRSRAAGRFDRVRGLLLASRGAHSSVASAARAMDADVLLVPTDDVGRLHGEALRATVADLAEAERERVFAVVATAGTTNAGVVDDLAGAADVATNWARGCTSTGPTAARRSPRRRCGPASPASSGPTASSSTRTSGCSPRSTAARCCTATRTSPGRRTPSTPSTSTCSTIRSTPNGMPVTTPTTCPAGRRGLPFWFSLATHGTDAYRDAVEQTLAVTRAGAELIDAADARRVADPPGAERAAVPADRLDAGPVSVVE